MNTDTKNEMVLFSSEEAAHKVIIDGWVSRNGYFYGDDERAARYDGCTHVACERCGKPVRKGWLACDECREKREAEKYAALERKEWDGEGMIYSDSHDQYFDCWEDVDDLIDELSGPGSPVTIESLRLLICEPQYAREVDTDYWSDDLPEDGDLPPDIEEALEEFNAVIRNHREPLSWIPGKYAVRIPLKTSTEE